MAWGREVRLASFSLGGHEQMAGESEKPESTKKAVKPRRKIGASGKRNPWTFPKNTLEDAIRIPKAIEEKNYHLMGERRPGSLY